MLAPGRTWSGYHELVDLLSYAQGLRLCAHCFLDVSCLRHVSKLDMLLPGCSPGVQEDAEEGF